MLFEHYLELKVYDEKAEKNMDSLLLVCTAAESFKSLKFILRNCSHWNKKVSAAVATAAAAATTVKNAIFGAIFQRFIEFFYRKSQNKSRKKSNLLKKQQQ